MNIRVSLIILLLAFSKIITAQNNNQLYKVREDLYVINELDGGNVAFLVNPKGIIVIDAGSTPSEGDKIVSIIKKVSNVPIKYLVLTHFHGDHINGVSAFPDDVTIIAHEKLFENNALYNEPNLTNYINNVFPKYMENIKLQMDSIENKESEEYKRMENDLVSNKAYYEDIKRIKLREPDKTFKDYYKIKLGDERIILEYTGPGHTNDNIVVKFSNHNVIHTADLVFNGTFPYLIVEHGVDVYNWIQILDDLFLENISRVIPGHGEVTNKKVLKEQADYFRALGHKIEALMNAGYDLDEIKKRITAKEFKLKGNEDQLPINIEVIYSELIKSKNKDRNWWKF